MSGVSVRECVCACVRVMAKCVHPRNKNEFFFNISDQIININSLLQLVPAGMTLVFLESNPEIRDLEQFSVN